MEKTKNILITSAGRRVSLVKALQREVSLIELESKVFTTDLNPTLSSACQVSDGFFKVKRVTDKNYIQKLLEICEQNLIKLVIPTIDTELEILAESKDVFLDKGIIILVSDAAFIKKCRDKRLIHDFFDSINLRRAIEFDKQSLRFPVFVKPSDGSRSQGIFLIESENDLTSDILLNEKNMFLEYFSPEEHSEFTVDIYFTKNSTIKCVVPRERIAVRDGEVNTACTRKNSIVAIVRKNLKDTMGLFGCITLQVFYNKITNDIIGIEINPRFGGGYPLSYQANANFPKWIIEEYLLNKKIEEYFGDWENNLLMIRYDQEIIVDGYKG